MFSKKNLQLALSYLLNSIKESEDISIEAVTYLTSDCIYGSGMEDNLDRSTLQAIFSQFCCEEVVTGSEHNLDPAGVYTVKAHPSLDAQNAFMEELPRGTSRQLLGMAEPVARHRDTEAAHSLLRSLSLTQGVTVASSVLTTTGQVLQRVDSLLAQIPEPFHLDVLQGEQGEERFLSLSIVLAQELRRCNLLLRVAREAMVSCQEAIQGRAVLTEEVETVLGHVKENSVLEQMKALNYPTTYNLSQFVTALASRAAFLRAWAEGGLPHTVPLAAITQPNTLITALLQVALSASHTPSVDTQSCHLYRRIIFTFTHQPLTVTHSVHYAAW